MKFNFYLVKSSLVGALGGLLFGFDTAVIAGTTHALTITFGLTSIQLGITVSIALWGTVLGAMFSGVLGEKLGGRGGLRIMAALYVLSALGSAFAWSWSALLIFRFIGGIGIGGSSVLGPVYIAEIAPAKWRGRMVGMFQINVVIGILLAYGSNFALEKLNLGHLLWRYQLGVAVVPAILFFVLLFAIPMSSRWLVTQNRLEDARSALELIGSPDSRAELREIVDSIHLDRATKYESLFSRKYTLPIFLAVSLGMFNQLSGINAILYYLNDIFASAGFSRVSSDLQAVVIGATNLVATLIAMTLIDKLGRKTLLLVGSVGMVICLVGVAGIFAKHERSTALLWFLVGFIISFASSQGAVIWVYISEIFPSRVRSRGQGIGSSAHWITNALIAAVFPAIAARSTSYPFYFFAAMMALQFVFVMFLFPETKGVSLEKIQAKLGIA